MDEKAMFECGIRYFQMRSKDFTPIAASADFSALKRPKPQHTKAEFVEEIGEETVAKAA